MRDLSDFVAVHLRRRPIVENLVALSYKVYARRSGGFSPVEQELGHAIGAAAQVLYLMANNRRRDLLFGIEAVGN